MGNSHTKKKSSASEKVEGLKNKVRLLEGEIKEIMCMRENESQAYEREMMVFAIKEDQWRKERKKLKVEIKMLRKKLDYIEERFKDIENELELFGITYLKEEHRSEQDEAAEKWKQLYFAIKIELDELILRTRQEENNDTSMKMLHKQLKAKGETIQLLQAQVASMKEQESKAEREVDILRQSLRIMSHQNKPAKIAKTYSKH